MVRELRSHMPHGVVKKKYQIIWNKKEIFNSCLSTPLPSREEPRFPQWEMDPAPGLLFSHSVVSDSETPWTAAHQACLSLTISQSLLRLISIKSVIPSNYLILCHSLLLLPSIFPSIRVFPISWLSASGDQSIVASASASVFPVNIQS